MNTSITPKLKICSVCGDSCRLWTSMPKMCKECAQRSKISLQPKIQVTLTQTKNGGIAKPFKAIKKISVSQQQRLAKYRRLRDKYFEEHPVCEFPGCKSKKITLHHKRGRVGAFLTDKRTFCSLCQKHHRYVEENPTEAKKLGLSDNRL